VSDLLTKIQSLLQNYTKVELRSITFPLSLFNIRDILGETYRFLRAFSVRKKDFY